MLEEDYIVYNVYVFIYMYIYIYIHNFQQIL